MPKSTNVAEELNQEKLNQKYIKKYIYYNIFFSLNQWNILYKIAYYIPEYFL